jgi:hypothetical protein
MQLTAQDKKAAREGFAYVVVRGGKRVCYASTLGEAKRECGKTGRVVSISGMRYAAQNPFRGSLNVRNPSLNVRNPSNAAVNRAFLKAIDAATRNKILSSIGKHYGITANEAMAEVTDAEAENLLDYMVEPMRSATFVIMQRHGFGLARRNPSINVRNPSLNVRNPSAAEVGHSVGKYGKYAARGAGRAAKSALQGTKSFFGSAYASFKKHNPADFASLSIGQEFDFVSGSTFDSFYDRCVKTSSRTYMPIEGKLKGKRLTVGSTKTKVYHVGSRNPSLNVR